MKKPDSLVYLKAGQRDEDELPPLLPADNDVAVHFQGK